MTEQLPPHPIPPLPAAEITEFFPRRSKYLIVIPVLNEGERIKTQLVRMAPYLSSFDTIIVDGGSTDGSTTAEALQKAGLRALLIKKAPGRLGTQIRIGLLYGLKEGYEGVILIDGNNKDDPAAIPEFAKKIDQGFDFIQGSRFVPGGKALHNPLSRLLGIKLLHAPLLSLFSGVRYTDTTNGFRAFNRAFLADPRVAAFRDVFTGYEYHYYLSLMAGQLGFKVIEIPVTREYPEGAPPPSKIKGVRANLSIIQTLLKVCFGGYAPSKTTVS
jgi:dolichol-phosphate mannosyltransferase